MVTASINGKCHRAVAFVASPWGRGPVVRVGCAVIVSVEHHMCVVCNSVSAVAVAAHILAPSSANPLLGIAVCLLAKS